MGSVFDKSIRKSCAWCKFGIKSDFSNEIFCKSKGIVSLDDVCRKYKYDVLKRTPADQTLSKNYSPDDFQL